MGFLKIGRVQGGLHQKLLLPEVIDLIKRFDVFIVLETWLIGNTDISLEGYEYFRSDRKKNKKAKRGSGGVCVFIKKHIFRGVHKLNSLNDDCLWLVFKKNFFNIVNDIFLACCYIPPSNSKYHGNNNVDMLDILQDEISCHSCKGDVMIMGDLNCRVGNKIEQWVDVIESPGPLAGIELDHISVPMRFNQDSKSNSYGSKLLTIMNESLVMLVNGRTPGDMLGNLTFHGYRGSSSIDLCITNRNIYNSIQYFKVLDNPWYSDHSPIALSLRVGDIICHKDRQSCNLSSLPTKYKWDVWGKKCFREYFKSEAILGKLASIQGNTSHYSGNDAVEQLSDLIISVANKCLSKCKTKSKKQGNLNKWHRDSDVSNSRKTFQKLRYIFRNDQSNITKRQEFLAAKRKYANHVKIFKSQLKLKELNKLVNIEKDNPKLFWKQIKRMIGGTQWERTNIEPNDWLSHFTNLLSNKVNGDISFQDYVNNCLPVIERFTSYSDCMDASFNINELNVSIKRLKNGKSCGIDSITNEMISEGGTALHESILTIFNYIFRSGTYPTKWRDNIILPIFKSGNKSKPDNYRGIAITSCLGKLFTCMLNTRIEKILSVHNIISPNQNGFKKGHRTEDNLFILRSIFEKYSKRRNKKIYVTFVDFSKYFDLINRDFLYYKMQQVGITGNIYNMIKSMYSSCHYLVNCGEGLSPPIPALSGLKQGCNLSPNLSNVFQNDIHSIFDQSCDPVELGSISFNSLSWADDMVLLSTSEIGLQRSLDALSKYCRKWTISVNTDKTVCMILSKGKTRKYPTFFINDRELKYSSKVSYLGLCITPNFSMSAMIEDRILKAKRASYLLRQALSVNGGCINIKLATSLFDKFVSPVLMYGCCIWGTPNTTNLIYLSNIQEEGNTAKLVSDVLKASRNNQPIIVKSAKRIGKLMPNKPRDVLVDLHSVHDKFAILFRHDLQGSVIPRDFDFKIDNLQYEKLHTSFLKSIMGVNKYSSNLAILGESGRYPISIKIIALCIKYWHTIVTGNSPNMLLNEAFRSESEHSPWTQCIQYVLNVNGLGHIWLEPSYLSNVNVYSTVHGRLKDQYIQDWFNKAKINNSLDVLNYLKKSYTVSPYLSKILTPNVRGIFARLRINNSILYHSKSTGIINVCPCCTLNVVETVKHFLLECPFFAEHRNEHFKLINDSLHYFISLSKMDKYKILLDLSSEFGNLSDLTIRCIITYIKSIYNMRKNIT